MMQIDQKLLSKDFMLIAWWPPNYEQWVCQAFTLRPSESLASINVQLSVHKSSWIAFFAEGTKTTEILEGRNCDLGGIWNKT